MANSTASGWQMNSEPLPITVCMMCLNEARHMPRALAQSAAFAEWIVLDTGSTDETVSLAKQGGVRVEKLAWMGFSETRRRLFLMASQPWILWIDADEEITSEFVSELQTLFSRAPQHSAYKINRTMFFEGRWIRHGEWYPDFVLRLFRSDSWNITPSSVHESIIINGSCGNLKTSLPHYSYHTWSDRNRRIRDYALLWAKQEAKKDKKSSETEAILRAIWRFFRAYVIKAGALDGGLGFKIACSCAMEVYLKYMALAILLRHQIGRSGVNG